jgi:hypothetical protein
MSRDFPKISSLPSDRSVPCNLTLKVFNDTFDIGKSNTHKVRAGDRKNDFFNID